MRRTAQRLDRPAANAMSIEPDCVTGQDIHVVRKSRRELQRSQSKPREWWRRGRRKGCPEPEDYRGRKGSAAGVSVEAAARFAEKRGLLQRAADQRPHGAAIARTSPGAGAEESDLPSVDRPSRGPSRVHEQVVGAHEAADPRPRKTGTVAVDPWTIRSRQRVSSMSVGAGRISLLASVVPCRARTPLNARPGVTASYRGSSLQRAGLYCDEPR